MRIWGAQSPRYCLTRLTGAYDIWTVLCHSGDSQRWILVPGTNAYRTDDYRIVSATGLQNECLEQPNPGNTFVWVAWCHGGSTQNWWISRQDTANRSRNESSLYCLDMSHVNGQPNGTITSWPCYQPPTRNQQWFHGWPARQRENPSSATRTYTAQPVMSTPCSCIQAVGSIGFL